MMPFARFTVLSSASWSRFEVDPYNLIVLPAACFAPLFWAMMVGRSAEKTKVRGRSAGRDLRVYQKGA
jgi:hypothetical protein